MTGVTSKDFQFTNTWSLDTKGEVWNAGPDKGKPVFLIDETTGRKYFNEWKGVVRFKCILLIAGTPFVHAVAPIVNIGYRILKLGSFSHFWVPKSKEKEPEYNFKARRKEALIDVLRIPASLIVAVPLTLAAIYGVFRPYDGRKLYASTERAVYGDFILAPCFQPNPKLHAFGGDIKKQNAF